MRLFERIAGGGKVDREAGVVYGVKVLGRESKNGRVYSAEAIERAKGLYENAVVNADHPAQPGRDRSIQDRIGWLRNVRVGTDGLYADLHLLMSDPRAPKIIEAAEKNPALLGLSHNAEGRTHQQGDLTIVDEISEVHSVDVVADPASVNGLFEGVQTMTTEAFCEAITTDNHEPTPEPQATDVDLTGPVNTPADFKAKVEKLLAVAIDADEFASIVGNLLGELNLATEKPSPVVGVTTESRRRPAGAYRNPWDGPTAAEAADLVWNIT